jgi:hypothetical protein
MHVKLLELNAGALVDARVDDELWCNARVPLDDLGKAERSWLTKVASRAIAAIAGDIAALGPRVRLAGDGTRNTVLIEGRDRWEEAAHDGVIDDEARGAARDALAMFLEAVQGALLFGDDTRGLTRRARGDSPA